MKKKEIEIFRRHIWNFYWKEGRHKLPWRKTRNSYKILVSEIMLQQTQVARVLLKYPEFLKVFPNILSLAKASFADVLRVWQGMGYNRRALALHTLAKEIVKKHKGKIPRGRRELEALPGIGPYTAGAIRVFAFNKPEIFIETNIRRVFIHHFFQLGRFVSKSKLLGNETSKLVSDKEILPLVKTALDTGNPREWYYALMDYGAHLPKITRKNSNTQSKHYVKQGIFRGSLRELRGKIIRALGEGPKTLLMLKRICDKDARTEKALSSLAKDNLIIYEKRKYKIA